MRSLMYLMAMMTWIFSLTACSMNSDGHDDDAPEQDLIGTWDAVCCQYYEIGEGYGTPTPETDSWTISSNTITTCDRVSGTVGLVAGYSFDGRRLVIDGQSLWEVVSLSGQLMLLRQEVRKDEFKEMTFKRR